jgi:hypothetical protein
MILLIQGYRNRYFAWEDEKGLTGRITSKKWKIMESGCAVFEDRIDFLKGYDMT